MKPVVYAMILAGGSGTRLWPRSRERMPKQFLDITGSRSMLQEAVDRVEPLIPLERTFVITNREYVSIVQEQLPALPPANVIGELAGRGTAPAIGLGAVALRHVDPDATMIVLTADHLIRKRDEFLSVLGVAVHVAEDGHLVTLGIHPTHAETGYGYIERGGLLRDEGGYGVYRVERFTEKPDLERAEAFVRAGRYSWNSGMFIWKVETILEETRRLMPAMSAHLDEIAESYGTPRAEATLQRVWPEIEKQTIDFGIMERAERVAVIPVDIGWNDVGSWGTLLDLLPGDQDGNILTGNVVAVDTDASLIYSSGRLIAAIGLREMVVVDTEDATLICPKDRAQDVRQIVDRLRDSGLGQLLS